MKPTLAKVVFFVLDDSFKTLNKANAEAAVAAVAAKAPYFDLLNKNNKNVEQQTKLTSDIVMILPENLGVSDLLRKESNFWLV